MASHRFTSPGAGGGTMPEGPAGHGALSLNGILDANSIAPWTSFVVLLGVSGTGADLDTLVYGVLGSAVDDFALVYGACHSAGFNR